MNILFKGFFLIFILQAYIFSFYSQFNPEIIVDSIDKGPNNQMSDEEILNYFQVYFIKENFLNPAFSNRHDFFGEDPNEEKGEFSMSSEFEQSYSRELVLKEVAKIMAEKNIFHLDQYLKREHHLIVQ